MFFGEGQSDWPLPFSGLLFSRQQTDMFLTFCRKQILTFHANWSPVETICMKCQTCFPENWGQFAWNVKICFLEKIRKIFENVACSIFIPRHQKSGGVLCYTLWNFECLSVSTPTILLPATPPTVLGQSFSNFTGAFRMVWRYAFCFFRILKLFFITFFAFLT